MVHAFIYENLLSFSKNRDYYVKLFEISITKRKILDQKSFANINLLMICDELLKETRRKDSMNEERKKFYLTSQLTYGTLIFYRWQTDNLLVKVKAALVSCNLKFGDPLTSLSQVSRTSKSSKKSVKRNNATNKEEEASEEDDDAFKKPANKRPKLKQEVDATMVTNIQSITMIETQTITRPPVALPQEDFGEMTEDEFNLFFGDQQPPIVGTQDLFTETQNDAASLIVQPSKNPPFPSQLSPIQEEIDQHTYNLSSKRALEENTEAEGVSPNKMPRLSQDENGNLVIEDPNETVPQDNPSREITAMETEQSVLPENNEILPQEENPEKNETLPPEENPEIPIKKSKKRGQKLIVDEFTKISTKAMEKQMENCSNLMIDSPINSFRIRMIDIKMNLNNLVPFPLRTRTSEKLLFLYQRNLMKVPMRLLKKQNGIKKEPEAPMTQERKSLRIQEKTQLENSGAQNQNESIAVQLEEIPEIPPVPQVPEIAQIPEPEIPEIPQVSETAGAPQRFIRSSTTQTYDEKSKWSREQVLEHLEKLWRNKKTGPINMEKFKIKNRFIFAGIFFELLTLNKMEVIELVQDEGSMEIDDIKKGKNY